MVPRLQLVYFPVRAKAEMIRMALAYGNVPYVFKFPKEYFQTQDWKEAKPLAPFGQLPVLDVDGKVLAQSGSLLFHSSFAYSNLLLCVF